MIFMFAQKIFSSLIVIFLFFNFSYATDVHSILKEAVTCNVDPLGKIRSIVSDGNNFKDGYATASYGDGSANTAIVILDNPIEIAGSKSSEVFGVADLAVYFDFNGIVYAKFRGDYKRAVSELNLSDSKGSKDAIGKYQRKLSVNADGKPYEICPMTIALTPLEEGEFLLGCGWCNG